MQTAKTEYPRRLDDLDINPAEEGYIIYQPDRDRVHYLNHTAVLVLELCTGENSSAEIVAMVKDAYALDQAPTREIEEILVRMKEEGLFVFQTAPSET